MRRGDAPRATSRCTTGDVEMHHVQVEETSLSKWRLVTLEMKRTLVWCGLPAHPPSRKTGGRLEAHTTRVKCRSRAPLLQRWSFSASFRRALCLRFLEGAIHYEPALRHRQGYLRRRGAHRPQSTRRADAGPPRQQPRPLRTAARPARRSGAFSSSRGCRCGPRTVSKLAPVMTSSTVSREYCQQVASLLFCRSSKKRRDS